MSADDISIASRSSRVLQRIWVLCRFAGGAQLDSQSHGAFATYRTVSNVRRNHLRNRRPRTILRVPAQDLLRQPHPSVLQRTSSI